MELMNEREFRTYESPFKLRLDDKNALAKRVSKEEKLHAFCQRLKSDLRTHDGITHVEPVARANYYHDPVFKPFRDRCPGLELNGFMWPMGDGHDPEEKRMWAEMSEDEADELRRAVWFKMFGTRNFKMYRLDLDGDPSNGEEHVFHSERAYRLRDQVGDWFNFERVPKWIDWNDLLPPEGVENVKKFWNGGFTVLDLDRCKRVTHRETYDPYFLSTEKTREAFSGLFLYRGRYYAYNVSFTNLSGGPDFDGYSIDVDRFEGRYFSRECSFSEVLDPTRQDRSTK